MPNQCDPSALGEANSSDLMPLRRGILGSGIFGDCEMLYVCTRALQQQTIRTWHGIHADYHGHRTSDLSSGI